MNTYQLTLYRDLMTLVDQNEAFYFADHEFDGATYRIFNYRLASYTDFLEPNALECRGVMFQIDHFTDGDEPIRLAALPMEKFFNLYENPFTMDLDLSSIVEIAAKADGSLISTYMDDLDDLRLKSKGSLHSEQAIDAMAWLDRDENIAFRQELYDTTRGGFTVNMEWCSPTNRIVLGYEEPHLTVLNVRDNTSGEYVITELVQERFDHLDGVTHHVVDYFEFEELEEFVASIPDMQGIEGFVVQLESGQRVKIKTSWYMALHHTKDSINSPRRLFEAVLEEATDDMKSMFYEDRVAIQMIENMELFVERIYNNMVDMIETFYEANKHLERKEYAILGQKEFAGTMYFGLVMSKYVGKEFSYKEFLKRKWKELGLKDVEKDSE